jgi:hypothetical protein
MELLDLIIIIDLIILAVIIVNDHLYRKIKEELIIIYEMNT